MKFQINPLFYFLIVGMLFSCSDDDSTVTINPPAEEIRQVKKITETVYYSGTSETHVYDFNYENGILRSYETEGYQTRLSYDGNKITQTGYFHNGAPTGSTSFHYQGNQLSYTLSDDADQEKTEYFYQNGQLSFSKSGYMNNGEYVILETRSYVFDHANLLEETANSFVFGSEQTSRLVYTHDNKINPLKYMNSYLRLAFRTEGLTGLGDNNIISRTSYWNNSSTPSIQEYEITYDGNYPVLIRKKTQSGSLVSETQIEYL